MVEISVIVPVYNQEEQYLKECLQSIKNQTLPRSKFEIVVIDDGSDDAETVKKLAKEVEAKYIRQKNLGIGAARQRGVDESNSTFVSFLSSDDKYYPTTLEIYLSLAEQFPDAIQYSDYTNIDENGNELGTYFAPHFSSKEDFIISCWAWAEKNDMFVNFSTLFAPKKVFEKVPFDKEFRIGEDLMWVLMAMRHFEFKHLSQPTMYYRRCETQTTTKKMNLIPENNKRIIAKAKKYWRLK